MFSSENSCYETPIELYNELDSMFGFTLDPCASHKNHKCETYFTVEEDGLNQSWKGHSVFVNPPYNKPEKKCEDGCKKKSCLKRGYHNDSYLPGQIDWVRKCRDEWLYNKVPSVVLIPSRTDTSIMHNVILPVANAIWFLEGRLTFCIDGVPDKSPAPFPSMIVIFGNHIPSGLLNKSGLIILR